MCKKILLLVSCITIIFSSSLFADNISFDEKDKRKDEFAASLNQDVSKLNIRHKMRAISIIELLSSNNEEAQHNINLSNIPISNNTLNALFKLTWIKFIDLTNCGLKSIPSSISNMRDLEYLNLSGNKLQYLPLSIQMLIDTIRSINLEDNDEFQMESTDEGFGERDLQHFFGKKISLPELGENDPVIKKGAHHR